SSLSSSSLKIILDLSDGSMLTLIGAMAAKKSGNNNVRFVSLEEKFFSRCAHPSPIFIEVVVGAALLTGLHCIFVRLLHDQLVGANELEDFAFVWDGELWEDVHEFLHPEEDDNDDKRELQRPPLELAALIAEPFYYQM